MYSLVIKQDSENLEAGRTPLEQTEVEEYNWRPVSLAARVTPTLPKQDRPVREGTRVASIETGLAAAAAKLAQQVSVDTQLVALLLMTQSLKIQTYRVVGFCYYG